MILARFGNPSALPLVFADEWRETMGPVFFVMAIMGCGDGNTQCAEARIVPTHYVTAAQCRADLPAMLARNTDLSYPVISAACRANGPQIASAYVARRGS